MLPAYLLTCLICVLTVQSSPVPYSKSGLSTTNRVLYDQRQEGEWNVRADLKNFVILIIPKSTAPENSSPGSPPSGTLLDFLFRSLPANNHHSKRINKNRPNIDQNINVASVTDAAIETRHFIEAKSAPYQVDISKTKEELSKLHPDPETGEVVIAKSPAITLVKEQTKSRAKRFTRAFVLTVPEDDFVLTKTEDIRKVVKKDGNKKKFSKTKVHHKEEMKLLGANEQCGPDGYRDAQGICRLKMSNNY